MKEEIYKQKMTSALIDFQNAYNKLVELFNDCDNDCNNYICDNYPFEKSFDEIPVDDWVNSTIDNLDKKIKDSDTYYYDCDNCVQYYSDWGVGFIERYKDRVIVKEEGSNYYMIWATNWNRPLSRQMSDNSLQPIKFNYLDDVKNYIDSRL